MVEEDGDASGALEVGADRQGGRAAPRSDRDGRLVRRTFAGSLAHARLVSRRANRAWPRLIGDVIDAALGPRIAAQNAPDRQPAPLYRAVLFERLKRIGRTGRVIAAAIADPWRQNQTVGPHGQRYDIGKRRHVCTFFNARRKSAISVSKDRVAVTSLRPTNT